MKLSILIVASLLFLNSCDERINNNNVIVKLNHIDTIERQNLKLLDSLHLMSFNDTSKWLLYAIHCDDSIMLENAFNRKVLPNKPLGFLRISLSNVEINSDTLSLLYSFLYNDSTIIQRSEAAAAITGGIRFGIRNKNIIGYFKGNAIYSEKHNPASRYENALQPEVIAFIKNNRDKLNPWFREEAKRRKIIE